MKSSKVAFNRIFVFFCLFNVLVIAQNGVPHTLYQQFNGPFDYTIIGNTHNPYDNWVFPPQLPAMYSGSSANLSLSSGQSIEGAYLIWAGIGDGVGTSVTLNGLNITPDYTNFINISLFPLTSSYPYFSAVKDITNYVQNYGNGIYQISNFNLSSLLGQYYSNSNQYAGWNIVVVYSSPTLSNKQLNIYDGYRFVVGNGINTITLPINNLNVTNTIGAKMTYIVYNGSPNFYPSENAKFNGQTLSNAQNPPNNPFNGTNTFTGSNTSWNMDVDTYAINNYISIGNTSATFTMSSGNYRMLSTIITSIQSELPDATISLDSITGQDICQNQDLTLDYTVYNVNSNDTLLAGTPISVYANNNVLLSTFTLPSNILIGDSLSLSTMVTIPASIASPFNLSMVVNQNATQLGVYPESNFGNNTSNDSTISLTTVIYPNFGNVGPFCQGTSYTLPSVSLNNVDGVWSPAFNNQSSGTYAFIPNNTTCNQSLLLTVEIVPQTTPLFNITSSICENGTVVFPAVTQNGVHGTWSPALNNQSTTTYTFTPDIYTPAVGCPTSVQHTLTVIPSTLPTFILLDSICLNGQLTLPTLSDNSISGTWSPAFDNQNSATYTFTPDVSNPNNQNFSCLVSAQHSVAIIPPTTPNFSFVTSLCAGSTFALSTISDNGIAGTWSLPFNNQVSANYTFTPDTTTVLGSCAPSVTESITIIPTLSPSFNFADSLCEEAVFNFPDVSIEGITGIWTPTFNNQTTQNYTFTPSSVGITNTSLGLRCPQVVNQIMTILANPIADFTPQYSVLPLYMPSTILDNNSSNAYTYFWNFGDGTTNDSIFSPEHTFPEEAGSYLVSLQVSNQLGCMDTTSQVIVVEHDPVVFIPNAFTPDGDGLNNEFTAVFPENMKLASYEMYIYDRWGELVFYSQDPKQGWDASLAGFDAPDGVYSYLVKYKEFGYVNKFQVTGSVVVIR
jgi:gliding motility-associated-like protein